MEICKPIVTYTEKDIAIPEQLKANIVHDIPQEGIEWQRSYGRSVKTVFLEAQLVSFCDDHLQDASVFNNLFEKPLLHTFWLECYDIDTYKISVRDELISWIARLQKHGVVDWLVIVFESAESRKINKSKLLSRSSVVDKIKADFPQNVKNAAERCVSLTDPLNPKSNEAYQQLLQRIRSLLSNACSRQLSKYEDFIRMQRENRNSRDWNFFRFFIMQEQLAFAFEMFGLFDEALVQYDELDALFSQFVLNSNVGGIPVWLKNLSERCDVWHGLCLSKSVYTTLRNKIKDESANLLDLRNYLFARQCELLLLHNKPWEVASRSLPFLQNCVNELNLIEVDLTEGAVACWVFLSALEILQKCERYSDSSQMETYSRFTVGLWAYARKKLEELGILCGLMPDMSLTSDCLIKVVTLIAGMGQDPHSGDESQPSPQMRLKEALSKPESFLKQYLEISELTMGTYKHIGHLRFAKLIGKELAFLYMKLNEHQKSLPFLLDLEKTYLIEKWSTLLMDIRKYILKCYEILNDYKKQVRYNCLLAATSMTETCQSEFLEKAKKLVDEYEPSEESFVMNMDEIFPIISLSVSRKESLSTFELVLKIESKLCQPVHFERLIAFLHYEPQKPVRKSNKSESNCCSLQKASKSHSEDIPTFLTFTSSVGVGVQCPNITKCLKRSDSQGTLNLDGDLQKPDLSDYFSLSNISLNPGINEFHLTFESPSRKCGIYSLTQLYLDWNDHVSFASLALPTHVCFEVISEEPRLKVMRPMTLSEPTDLISGLLQRISLELGCGSYNFVEGTLFNIRASRGLKIKLETEVDCMMGDEVSLVLKSTLKPFDIYTIPLIVFASLCNQKDASATEYQISLNYRFPGFENSTKLIAAFHMIPSFISTMKLHTLNKRKLVEILVNGITNSRFELISADLHLVEAKDGDVEIKSLIGPKTFVVKKDQTAHLLWELISENSNATAKSILFEVKYKPLDGLNPNTELYDYTCDFKLNDYHTQYSIRATVEAQKGHEFCRVGSLCHLYVIIERLVSSISFPSIMYEVIADGSFWNISGRTAGVLNETSENVFKLSFEILPLTTGFLPLPSIRLSKYIACEKQSTNANVAEAKLVAFDTGQVYNWSRGLQINVLPSSGLIIAE
ncbi:trafficking protein particle complex subunit 10-like protein [Dinothrombium tinctorium]|uniref:Trafficking protein particle complex subunit 10-like protein n=1 Tax=Dinothrombium tinctorium TaxID=1965070 RepID=A0A443RAL7_9ACAR|nr:trafficking protein particle complex subunit 10-like protein [Dinothrombium tinctorium]